MIRGLYNHFNRGEVDERLLARDDVDHVKQTGSYVENFMPVKFGPMYYREGTEYLGSLVGGYQDDPPALIPFVAATDDTALVELNPDGNAYVWIDGVKLTRGTITSSLTNPNFTADLSGWTDDSGAGSSTAWSSDFGGSARLQGALTTDAVLYQTTMSQSAGVENGLRIEVEQGEIVLLLGVSGVSSSEYYSGTLKKGIHSLAFTPAAGETITVTLVNRNQYAAKVGRVEYETGGVVALPHGADVTRLNLVRYVQSVDVVFCAQEGSLPFVLERRGTHSWSLVDYRSSKGPFGVINTGKVTLTPSGLTGNITLTASDSMFDAGHVGGMFKIASSRQQVTASVSAEDNGTNDVLVNGVGTPRNIRIDTSGTWSGTVTLQRSVDQASWEDIENYTSNVGKNYNDGLDNSSLYYRLWVKSGNYTSGTVNMTLVHEGGSIAGVCRVTKYISATQVNAEVLESFGSTEASRYWYEGEWSGVRGYPSAVELYEGRLWWAGLAKIWGSISDNYYAYDHDDDDEDVGDSAEIAKTVGFGPADNVLWLKASTRLYFGLASGEISVRSSSLGEVLTPNNVNLKEGSNVGSAQIPAVKIDEAILFVQRYFKKVYSLEYTYANDSHAASDLSNYRPMREDEEVSYVTATRNPEGRVWCLLDSGEFRILTIDKSEKVSAWSRWTTDGAVKAVATLPGSTEDDIYMVVDRPPDSPGGNGYRYLERKSSYPSVQTVDGTPATLDSSKVYTSPGTTITGLDHLEGRTVTVWADGKNRGTFTVSSGSITVPSSWTTVRVGLSYTALWVSNKLGGFAKGSVLGVRKRLVDVGLIASYLWPESIKLGAAAGEVYPLPGVEDGVAVDFDTGTQSYHELPFEFDGEGLIDPRVRIEATGPCMIQALVFGIKGGGEPSGLADVLSQTK